MTHCRFPSPSRAALALCAAWLAMAPAAQAQHAHAPAASVPGESTAAFEAGMQKMMKDMRQPYTGDADKDFVAHMLPHHRAAVDMAQVELQHGKDPELRRLAEDIVKAQEKEIAFMKAWQARQGAR